MGTETSKVTLPVEHEDGLTSTEVTNRVIDRFDGKAPMVGDGIDLHTIVRAVLDIIAEANMIQMIPLDD